MLKNYFLIAMGSQLHAQKEEGMKATPSDCG